MMRLSLADQLFSFLLIYEGEILFSSASSLDDVDSCEFKQMLKCLLSL